MALSFNWRHAELCQSEGPFGDLIPSMTEASSQNKRKHFLKFWDTKPLSKKPIILIHFGYPVLSQTSLSYKTMLYCLVTDGHLFRTHVPGSQQRQNGFKIQWRSVWNTDFMMSGPNVRTLQLFSSSGCCTNRHFWVDDFSFSNDGTC